MACKNDKNDIQILDDKFNSLSIISENWVDVEKSKHNDNSDSCKLPETDCKWIEKSSTIVPLQLRPYVPFTVEELSCTTRLDTWSNCNVRVIGLLQLIEGKHYLESINEPGGPYKVLIIFKCTNNLPSSNEIVQVFGEIKIISGQSDTRQFISVLFFRNLKPCNLLMYTKAIEKMRQYIPLFLNTESVSENSHDVESQYYHYHKLCDNEFDVNDDDVDVEDNNGEEPDLYSNDDFNYQYNIDM